MAGGNDELSRTFLKLAAVHGGRIMVLEDWRVIEEDFTLTLARQVERLALVVEQLTLHIDKLQDPKFHSESGAGGKGWGE